MVARARAFESYHATTNFIKATCSHCISSSPDSYRKYVSEPVPILCFVKQLSESLSCARRWHHWLPAWETGQSRTVCFILLTAMGADTRRKGRDSLGKKKQTKRIKLSCSKECVKKKCSEKALLRSELQKKAVPDAWNCAGAQVLFSCTDSVIMPLYKRSCSRVVWMLFVCIWVAIIYFILIYCHTFNMFLKIYSTT